MMHHRKLIWSFAAAVALAGGTAPGVAVAQESGARASEDNTIVVTARKREETLQDAPVAVTAIGTQDIERLQINSIDDVGRFAPGLSFSKTFGRTSDRPVIRGQSNVLAGVQFGVESGAAYFVDGVYYPTSIQSLDFGDIERVEVIKGPQSALYGRNTYSGAINFVTRRPGEEFGATGQARVAEHGEYEVRGSVDVPMGPDAGFRISLRDYSYDGEWTNGVTGETVGSESTTSGAIAFRWDMTPDLSLRLRGSISQDDDGPLPIFLQPASANNCQPGWRSLAAYPASGSTNRNQYFCGEIKPGPVFLNTGPRTRPLVTVPGVPEGADSIPAPNVLTYMPGDGTAFDGIERETVLVSAATSWDLGGSGFLWDVALAYRDEEEKFGTDSDHSAVNFFFPGTTEALFANTSRDDLWDLSFETTLSTPQDQRFRARGGGFFYYQANAGYDITVADPDGVTLLDDFQITRNTAVFGLLEADLTDTLTLTVEGRYAEESKSLRDNGTAGGPVTFARTVKFDAFTPRVTLGWEPTEDLSLYAIYAEGVKPGGLNGLVGVGVNRPTYDQEESKNWEVGAKGSLLGGRLTYTAAGYFIEATNVQLTTAVPPLAGAGATTSIVTNQGQGETWGLELTANARVTDNFTLGAAYSWTRPEFTQGCDEDQWILTSGGGLLDRGLTPTGDTSFDPLTGARLADNALGNCSIAGKRYPLVPEHQAQINAEYRQPVLNGQEFFVSGDVSYEGSKYIQVHNLAETGDATLVGARLGLEGERYTLSLFGRNLTDEDTIVLATRWFQVPYGFAAIRTPTFPATGASTGSPRAFFGSLRRGRSLGVELRVRY